MSLWALGPKTQVLRGGAVEGFGRVKRGRSENKETYIDSFPGKLCTAMLGEGEDEEGVGARGERYRGGRGGGGGGKGRKKRKRLKEDLLFEALGTQTLVIKS